MLKIRNIKRLTKIVAGFVVVSSLVFMAGLVAVNYQANPTQLAKALSVAAILPSQGAIAGGENVKITGDFTMAMSEMTAERCASMTVYDGTNPTAILIMKDTRNNQEYQVAKLADGNCWMLNNLKLGPGTYNDLTKSNIAFTLPDFDTSETTAYDAPRIYADDFDSGANKSATTDITSPDFYGYYYNWCAAMGGQPEACTVNTIRPTATQGDICPINWHLPTGGSTGEFAILNGSMYQGKLSAPSTGGGSMYAANWEFTGPFKGVHAGRRDGSNNSWHGQTSAGSYWSSTVTTLDPSSATSSHILYQYGSGDSPGQVLNRNYATPVRCMIPGSATTATIAPTVVVDGTKATVTAYSNTEIAFIAPAHVAGKVDIVITRGDETVTLLDGYEYIAADDGAVEGVIPGAPNTGLPDTY